ncbi:unnamed protein product [Sphenostylis stenocarpa]|uniref:FHA domain-containing protein n=1 Tax=Sphenostylis stenocarpa TaxID=92480 RepID=A0AA86VY40_9FABA|nr:unnamed protein product [Sphenostylis stenocarpa]
MGSEKRAKGEDKEGEIPVLTVLKNNTILKNIFIVNKPPERPSRADHVDVLLVGRHPDCDIMLTHPSISRFHLQIRSKPSSRTFSIVDLSSVHGTWLSGKRIEPMVSEEMREGDALRLGVSSRVYRLHWIPISRAYDLENPFVAQLDAVAEEDEEEEKIQKLNVCPAEMEVDSIVEDIGSLFFDENVKLTVKEEVPFTPWMLEEKNSQSKEEAIGNPSDLGVSDGKNILSDFVSQVLSRPYVESLVQHYDILTENLSHTLRLLAVEAVLDPKMLQLYTLSDTFTSPLEPGHENSFEKKRYSSSPFNTAHSSLDTKIAAEDVITPKKAGCEYQCKNRDDVDAFTVPASPDKKCSADVPMPKESKSEWTLRDDGSITDVFTAGAGNLDSEGMLLPVKEAVLETNVEQIKIVETVDMDSPSDEEKRDMYVSQSFNEIVQDVRNKYTGSISPTPHQIESVNLSMTEELVFNIMNEDQTLQSDMEILESHVKAMNKTSANYNIWSRRGKATSAPQVRTSKSTVKNAVNGDAEVAMSNEKDVRNRRISKNLFSLLDGEVEEEIFTPDKENFSPNILQLLSLKKGKVQEIKHSRSQRSQPLSKDTSNSENNPDQSIGPRLCKMNQKDIINKTISKDLFSVLDGKKEEEKEDEFFTPDKENFSPNTLQLQLLKKKGKVEEIKRSKLKRSPLSKDIFNPEIYPNESTGLCRMHQTDIINTTISEDLFSDLAGKEEEEIFTPNKANFSPNTLRLRLLKNKGTVEEKTQMSPLSKGTFNTDMYGKESIDPTYGNLSQKDTVNSTISKDFFSDFVGKEEVEDILTLDNENFSPNVLQMRLLKKKSEVAEIKHSKSPWDENQNLQRKPFCSHIHLAQDQHPVTSEDREERVPFQLLNRSGGKGRSNTCYPVSAIKSFHFSNCGQSLDQHINHPSDISGVPKKTGWDMIVDTSSLVNKESRKALQLLQGLKGTRLIIPRLVIRELNSMMRQFKIFRRTSEASLALEWIEECTVKTSWWINIQSSVDEGRLIAPTPPASPQTQFSEESWISLSYLKCMEIASPTVEDHILNFALLYRKNQSDGQLVLLSEDISLKIKCMAEGLLCEPVQEFRQSLVNPFSERFLWTNSSPRGQTWSCQDDLVLREKYCCAPLCKPSKRSASGLKLILLHNSQYGL